MSNADQTDEQVYVDDYPEHAKLVAVLERSQAIGEFIEWLPSRGLHLGMFEDERFYPAPYDIQELLAEFFEIDLNKIEAEKRAMLDYLRAQQA